MENLFSKIPPHFSEEIFSQLLQGSNFRLERIVSCGQATPVGEWLRQPKSEWVIVLQGQAKLRMKGAKALKILKPGDYVNIPAKVAHRVEGTDPKVPTVWLAVHYTA